MVRFRVGRKVGRTIYVQLGPEPSDDDHLVGMLETREQAEAAVRGLNEDVGIDADEIEVEHYRAPAQRIYDGPIGVKITHLPTGLTASCHTERSQLMNKVVAYREIKAALAEGITS